jgi:hypothetical protein
VRSTNAIAIQEIVMTPTTAQLNIPFELLTDAISTLNFEHKVKLWQMLGQEIFYYQKELKNLTNVYTSQENILEDNKASLRAASLTLLDQAVKKVLVESGMTEDELVEEFMSNQSS